MGYGGSFKDADKAIGKSSDEGIDGTNKELGLDIIYIQAKRWQPGNVVGRSEIHKFVGALAGQGAKHLRIGLQNVFKHKTPHA